MLNSSLDIFSDKILYMSLILRLEEKILCEEIKNKLNKVASLMPEEVLRIIAYEKLLDRV